MFQLTREIGRPMGARPRVRADDGTLTILTSLAEFRDGMQLVEVSFEDNEWVNDNDLLYFASLETLEALDLSKTAITQAGLERLGPLPNLKRLSLSQMMGKDVMSRAVELYPSLTTLDVSGTQVDDLTAIQPNKLPKLTRLTLLGTAVAQVNRSKVPWRR